MEFVNDGGLVKGFHFNCDSLRSFFGNNDFFGTQIDRNVILAGKQNQWVICDSPSIF